jgi:hypothetical protein
MVKVKITAGTNTIEHDLNRDQSLILSLETICLALSIPDNAAEYVLQNTSNNHYLTQQDLTNANFVIQTGQTFNLKTNPKVAATRAVDGLRDPKRCKIQVFELQKTLLLDEAFGNAFFEANGLPELMRYVLENQGGALAYGLKAIYLTLKVTVGWERAITEQFLTQIFPNISSTNLNVCRSALEVATSIAQSSTLGFPVADRCLRASTSEGRPYGNVVAALNSTDVSVQAAGLSFLNAMYTTCPDMQQTQLLDQTLLDLGHDKALKKMVKQLQDENLKLQVYVFQALSLRRLLRAKEVPYDKMNPKHEEMLLRLWQLIFPNDALSSRVSDQWKILGFQGTDPASDFRGMGMLGLHNLIYFAEKYTDTFRAIVKRNVDRGSRDYPAAVAGINITQLLFETLNVNKPINFNGPVLPIFRILFDHPFAFEEMYCTIFQVLDRTWDEMNASYMEFPKVIAAVKRQISDSLQVNPTSLDNFCRGSATPSLTGAVEKDEEGDEHPRLKTLKQNFRAEMSNMIQQQRLDYLREGGTFMGHGKTKDKKGQYFYMKADSTLSAINFSFVSTAMETTTAFMGSITKADMKTIVTGPALAAELQKAKKLDDNQIKRAFKIQTKTAEFELVANSTSDFLIWTDALRIWMGVPMQERENIEESSHLTEILLQIKTIDFHSAVIPKDPLTVPPPPTNFDFYIGDENTMDDAGAPQ